MKNFNFGHYLLLVIGILILIYVFSPSVRLWFCNLKNRFKTKGDKCSNCTTSVSGIITNSGECLPQAQVDYDKCVQDNSTLKDGSDCTGCGSNPNGSASESFSDKGVIVNGKCTALPDAFAGKICVPESAPVNASPLSYKRELISGNAYKYFKTPSNRVSQTQSASDTEILKEDYVQAFIQTITTCPAGQVKV